MSLKNFVLIVQLEYEYDAKFEIYILNTIVIVTLQDNVVTTSQAMSAETKPYTQIPCSLYNSFIVSVLLSREEYLVCTFVYIFFSIHDFYIPLMFFIHFD
jgi:hypothetical protein